MPLQHVFLAHSSKDKVPVRRIAEDLRRHGIPVWLDEWEIRVGDSIVKRVSDGIASAGWLAVALSETSVHSPWVERELNVGLVTELEARRVFVLPIRLDDCAVPTLLRDKRYADFRVDYEVGLADLIGALQPALTDEEVEELIQVVDVNVEILSREHVDHTPQMEAIEALERAAYQLGQTRQDRAVAVLVDLLDNAYEAICTKLVGALGIASPVGRMWQLVRTLIRALGDTASPRAVDSLVRVSSGKHADAFERECARSLARIARYYRDSEWELLIARLRAAGLTSDSAVVKSLKELRGSRTVEAV